MSFHRNVVTLAISQKEIWFVIVTQYFLIIVPLVHHTVFPLALPYLSSRRPVLWHAILLALAPAAFIPSTVGPCEHSLSVHQVVCPEAFVLTSIGPTEGPSPMLLIIKPLPFIKVSINICKATLSVSLAVDEPALIQGAVYVQLFTFSLTDILPEDPLPLVNTTIF